MFDVSGLPPAPWAKKSKPARSQAKPALTRQAIVDTALRIIDAEGLDAVSMRRIAQELGTGAASLYAHVADKEELLDLVVDQIMGEMVVAHEGLAAAGQRDWQEQFKDMARIIFQTLIAHGDVARAFSGRIPFGPNGLVAVEAQLALLRAAGLPDQMAAFAGDLLGQFVSSHAIDEVSWRGRFPNGTEQEMVEHLGELRDYLMALPIERFPNTVALAAQLLSGGSEELSRFELGLEVLVRGLASFLDRPAA
jgi:TetR/AcrR family transcriptional regulator, tetracycline repressor protein